MGYIIRFILFVIVFSWILKVVRRLFFRFFYRRHFNQQNRNPYNQSPKEERRAPETQEDRILDFQRKKFESTDIEDAEYEEVK